MVQMLGWFSADAAWASRSKRVWHEPVGKEFQGDEAVELSVLDLVNNTHPATTKPIDNAVVRDGLPDRDCDSAIWRSS
jgi:hypothetical protein